MSFRHLGIVSDVAVVDRAVGHGILGGLRLAKMDVRWYNHCDADDCARVFANLEAEDGVTSARLARPGRRRWLITEAGFQGTGRVAPLPELVALKETHHARLILDESCSFGAMGATGRGLSEHFDVDAGRVVVITASLEGAGASVGGVLCRGHWCSRIPTTHGKWVRVQCIASSVSGDSGCSCDPAGFSGTSPRRASTSFCFRLARSGTERANPRFHN